MLLKAGVDISKLNRPIRRTLNHVERIYQTLGQDLVITSTFDGVHSASSLHYSNDAYDCRIPKSNAAALRDLIKRAVGDEYDVVLESDHFHIEYDPKR